MKKYLVILLGLSFLAFAACNVETPEISIEALAPETHLSVNFNITRGDAPATKAVKTDWEEGDVVYFFFDKVTDIECLYLTYIDGAWVPYWTKRTYDLESTVAARGSGTVTGLYVFQCKSTDNSGYWGDDAYRDIDFYADDYGVQKVKAYTWFLTCYDASYEVVDGTLEADINLLMPDDLDFVQFFIPDLEGEPGTWTLKTDPVISSVTPYRYHRDYGIQTVSNEDNLMPGYEYIYGNVFCGVLPGDLSDVSTDYSFTLTNTETGDAYTYTASAKTLTRGSAVKLPILYYWEEASVPVEEHEYVDLGLSVKWATCDLGAPYPGAVGDYYAWGHLEPGQLYNWSDYRFYGSGSTDEDVTFTKYLVDGYKTINLDLEDDAAHAAWGGHWRMPTIEEWYELIENCSIVEENDGYRMTSNVSGYTDNSILIFGGSWSAYWSSTLSSFDDKLAQFYYVNQNYCSNTSRIYDLLIRPVYDESIGNPEPGGDSMPKVAMCEVNGRTLYVAEMNLGATAPEDPGKYYAWGETTGYTAADDHIFGYQFYAFTANDTYELFSKYVYASEPQYWGGEGDPDNLSRLQAEDDAASAALGSAWHMPQADEMWALMEQCDWEWDATRKGFVLTGRYDYSGNSVFLPAGGICFGMINQDIYELGESINYLSSELCTPSQWHYGSNYINCISDYNGSPSFSSVSRYAGMNVRAVRY